MTLFHTIFDQFYPLIRFLYERVQGNQWYDHIVDDIWLGGALSYKRDYQFLLDNDIGAVIDIRQEREDDLNFYERHNVNHLKIKVADLYPPTPEQITTAFNFINDNRANGRKVYIHCAKGRGRSATLIAGYLMAKHQMSFTEAHDFMVSRRKLVNLEKRHGDVLNQWIKTISPT
ncbi:MAG: dual specificity protein phosphatase [Chloroflexota bacterium]